MYNTKNKDTPPSFPSCDDAQSSVNCDALNRNMLAVSIASLLYDGKTKSQISDVVNFLHLLIALSKSY